MELSMKLSIFSLLGLLLQIAGQQNVIGTNQQTLEAAAGESVTIKCPIELDTNHFSLIWTIGYERENLAHHQRYKDRTKFNMEMTISHLTEEDSGNFFCHLKNGSKVLESGAVVLEVITTPDPAAAGQQNVPWIKPELLKTEAGTSLTMKCPIKPDTSRFSLVWTFGHEHENIAHHQRYKKRIKLGEFNMEITISNLTEEDSGIYFCQLKSVSKSVVSGVILEVIATPDPAGPGKYHETWFILLIIVGLETCIIILLLAVLIKCRFSGNSGQRNKKEVELQEICYADVSTTRINQRPRTKGTEKTITYAAIKPRE
ncbi:cell adhesion molecule CEACAM2-like [Phyllobates terribilis]|uniref:cell adhesion molecule CEACAM2-like n=1 Tax=Phyllobates terribilis TaxID=111132 RepID=UPI003CCAEB22